MIPIPELGRVSISRDFLTSIISVYNIRIYVRIISTTMSISLSMNMSISLDYEYIRIHIFKCKNKVILDKERVKQKRE